MALTLTQLSQGCEEAQTSAPVICQSSWSVWMEFGVLLRLGGAMKSYFHFILSEVACVQVFTDQFMSNLLETTELDILIPVYMILTSIRGQFFERSKACKLIFLQIS